MKKNFKEKKASNKIFNKIIKDNNQERNKIIIQ